jgi:hypothetical protein
MNLPLIQSQVSPARNYLSKIEGAHNHQGANHQRILLNPLLSINFGNPTSQAAMEEEAMLPRMNNLLLCSNTYLK